MPPLFEVMRQTNPGSPAGAGSGPTAPGGQPTDPVRNQAFFRGQGAGETAAGNAALRLTPHAETDTPETHRPAPTPPAAAPSVPKPVEVRVGQARRNWVVQDTGAGRPEGDESSPEGALARAARGPIGKAPLAIPGMWIATAAAIALTVLVLVWIVAYRQGSTAKEQEFQGKLSNSAPAGPSPTPGKPAGASPGTGTVGPEHRTAREPEAPKPNPDAGKPLPPTPPSPAPAAADPAPAVDPRVADTNYLSVLTLREKADAVDLAKYLTAGGLPTATVAVKVSGGSSTVGWEVFVLQGIPSADFRRADDTRNAIHRKLEELGRKWNQDGRSRLNFARDNVTWRKFKPGS